jgi:hypothetical protein
MAVIELSNDFVNEAAVMANVMHRSLATQIEYWAKLGKIAEENPDLSMAFVKDILVSLQQVEAGDISEYEFG